MVYKSGALCDASNTVYNPVESRGYAVTLVDKNCGSGTYSSKGRTNAYNGNGYDSYDTYTTPNLNY